MRSVAFAAVAPQGAQCGHAQSAHRPRCKVLLSPNSPPVGGLHGLPFSVARPMLRGRGNMRLMVAEEQGGTVQEEEVAVVAPESKEEEGEVLIECVNVHKAFGTKQILKGASFKIRKGEAVGIIGPSGTGKSTILKIMAGLMMPDKGEVRVLGKAREGLISDERDNLSLKVGMVFQSAALFDSLTVGENVGFMLYEEGRLPDAVVGGIVAEKLLQVGLSAEVATKYPSELSGGMKKRVALARAIIQDETQEKHIDEVVMYDEPTAGLDPIASTVVEDLIRSLSLEGQGKSTDDDRTGAGEKGIAAYVVVTHQHSTIRRAVDRLIFLHEGKVVWQGKSEEFDTSSAPIVRQFATGSLKGPIVYQ